MTFIPHVWKHQKQNCIHASNGYNPKGLKIGTRLTATAEAVRD